MSGRRRFAILIYEDVEPIDIGAAFGVLSIARRLLPQIEMFVVASEAGPVRLTNGLVVDAHHGYVDCPPFDVLVITGGPGWVEQSANSATLDFIRRAASTSIVASICTGGAILAATGLLDGKRVTTRRCGVRGEETPLQQLRSRAPNVEPIEALLVDNGSVITGGGITLGIDTMLHVLGRLFGRQAAEETARLMEYATAWKANAGALPTVVEQYGPV